MQTRCTVQNPKNVMYKHCTSTVHVSYIHCAKLLINKLNKRTLDETKYFYFIHSLAIWCIYSAYTEYKEKIWTLYGACLVHIWCIYGACTVHS